MFRIDGPGATVDNKFTAGDPGQGVPATTVTDEWLNDAVQEELCGFVESAGLTLDKTDNTQLRQALEATLGAFGGLQNEAINGEFRIWQRGTSRVLTSADYGPDRFRVVPGTGGSPSVTVSRQEHTVGQSDVPDAGRYFCRWDQTVAATATPPSIEQRLEGIEEYQRDTITLSFYAKISAGTADLDLKLVQHFGTGSADSDVTTTGPTITVTTSWQRFDWTITVPNSSGKDVTSDEYTSLLLEGPLSATFQIDLDLFQVTRSGGPIPYVQRPEAEEVLLCQRYYNKSYALDTTPGTITDVGSLVAHEDNGTDAGGNAAIEGMQGFTPARMRKLPTTTWYSAGTGNSGQIEYPDGTDKAVTGTLGRADGMHGYPYVTSPPSGEQVARAHYVSEAEL